MRLSRLSLRAPKRCQASLASRITPPFSAAKSPRAKLPVSFSQDLFSKVMVALLERRLRFLSGLRFESNRDTQKVEIRPAGADDRKPHGCAIDGRAGKIDLRDAREAAVAGQTADAFAQGIQ